MGTVVVEGCGVVAGETSGVVVVVGGGGKEFSGVGGGGIVTDELVRIAVVDGIVEEVGFGVSEPVGVGIVIDEPVGAVGKVVGVVIGTRTGCVRCANAEDPSNDNTIAIEPNNLFTVPKSPLIPLSPFPFPLSPHLSSRHTGTSDRP